LWKTGEDCIISLTLVRFTEHHVARMGEVRNAYNILVTKPEGRDHLEDLGVDGRIILEWVLRNK